MQERRSEYGLTWKQQTEQPHGWDEIERSWSELKGEVKRQQWSKLNDEDVELVKGKYAELLGLLQERYGHAKEQAEREINDWAKRLKVDSAAELTALRDDVASLSASVGLVRRQAAAASGLDQTLAASKLKLEDKANEAVDHIKGVVVRMSVAAALAVAAAIFALLALITGLVALYVRLEPAYGVFQALGIVAGVLAVIALVLVSAAMIVARGRTSSRRH